MRFETLYEATRRYRLRDSRMKNADIAGHLGAAHGQGDYLGSPTAAFFRTTATLSLSARNRRRWLYSISSRISSTRWKRSPIKSNDLGQQSAREPRSRPARFVGRFSFA